MLDYHIHSNFSFDSKAKPREICEAACFLNIDEIAITDHFSFAPYSPNYLHFEPEAYFQIWTEMQREYVDQLTVRIGIELDEFANYPEASNQMARQFPWDFVIGSTHDLEGGTLRTYLRKFGDQEKTIHSYYDALFRAIEVGHFDVLAHFDLIKRYTADEGYPLLDELLFHDQIDAILKLIIQKGIALEVNTSGLFQACQAPFPSLELIKRYYQLGGRFITIGSDAHQPKDLTRGFSTVIPQLKTIGFTGLTIFQKRKKTIQTW